MNFRCNINLLKYLDFEIWKASNMIFQHCPYDECDEKYEPFVFEPSNESWDDEWHEVIDHQKCFYPSTSENTEESIHLEIPENQINHKILLSNEASL